MWGGDRPIYVVETIMELGTVVTPEVKEYALPTDLFSPPREGVVVSFVIDSKEGDSFDFDNGGYHIQQNRCC